MLIRAITVFGAMFALDFVWVHYTRAISNSWPARAALHAGILTGLGSIATVQYVDYPWLIIPAVAGASLGTYLATGRH